MGGGGGEVRPGMGAVSCDDQGLVTCVTPGDGWAEEVTTQGGPAHWAAGDWFINDDP